jgi:lipoate---protein ligase
MLLINNTDINPYFNIAAEEYLLKEFPEDIILLYINEPSIIIGKHQNALAEINVRYTTEKNIPVIRRISGGGAVYHDKGNLNFSFFTNGREGQLVDFRKFTKPIIEILQKSGIEARFEGKSDIRLNGLKISGNAEHVHKNRVLHHGTLLISADLSKLSSALHVVQDKYKDKAIKSVRSKITNIGDLLHSSYNKIEDLKSQIFEYFSYLHESNEYSYSMNDKENIKKLIEQKYNTWEWNFGYSPAYEFSNNTIIDGSTVKICLKVEKGVIIEAYISGYKELQEKLIGIRHYYPEIQKILETTPQLNNQELKELAWSFF